MKIPVFGLVSLLFLQTYGLSFQVAPIVIESKQLAIVLQVDGEGHVGIVHFGDKLQNQDEYGKIWSQSLHNDNNDGIQNNAYTPSGTWNLVEPALTILHADGRMATDLVYKSYRKIANDNKSIDYVVSLEDPVYKTKVDLHYLVYPDQDVIEQWAEISNPIESQITLQKYASANLYLTGSSYHLRHYHGIWAQEMKPEVEELTAGIKTLDSKLGTRANLFQPPSFILGIGAAPSEDEGQVLLANLEWTGNFKIDFEKDTYDNLRLIAGINPHASAYQLNKGENFKTPALVYAYSNQGIGSASRNLHHWARKYKVFDGMGNRLTLLNNWEATYFDFNEEKLKSLFSGAKKLGVDMFLLDDGWFANKYPRNSDHSGLGDWQENKKKLPNGIPFLVKEAEKAGVIFGIWVEPEMVNPKSELYEQHPDWVIRIEDRPEVYYRNQLVLDLSNPKVQDFVFGVMDTLFSKNPSLAFIKWDCNAVIFNAHSDYLESVGKPQSHLYVDYVNAWYKVLDRVREKYPKVPMMLCSGGGGRADYKALSYFTEFWLSDNTDPIERIFIQWENSQFFPSIVSDNHITDWSKLSLKFRTDVAMMGKMGYDIVVDHLSENELQFSQQTLKKYDELKSLIWYGDQYRLMNPWENPLAAISYVSPDQTKAVLFNYAVSNRFDWTYTLKPIQLKGLDPKKTYSVKEINIFPGSRAVIDEKQKYSGDFLMKVGINPHVSQNRNSVVLEINEIK